MTQKKVVLVTGVGDYWGANVAARLIAETNIGNGLDYHVIGLDKEPPEEDIEGLDFIQADIRNPLLVDLLKSEKVHTVCHLIFSERVRPSEVTFDLNVMGTMKVLGACAEAGVHKVVLKSSMAVYGARPNNSAFIMERHPLHGSRAYGYTRDWIEIETFCNGFRRQVSEMALTILRFSSIIGPKADTPMTRFLKEPLAPVLLGFDPLMQVIHEHDVVEALVFAILNDILGVFNVAAEGILPLSQVLGLASKIPVPVFHPFIYWGAEAFRGTGLQTSKYLPIEADYIRYPWVGNLTKMRDEMGFIPHYKAEEALREFAGEQRVRCHMTEAATLEYDEGRLRDTIERRQRVRECSSVESTEQVEEAYNE